MSKVIRDCFGFALIRTVIGQYNSYHALNQSQAERKQIVTWSSAFSRAFGSLPVFSLSPQWPMMTQTFAMNECCDIFGLGF